MIGRILVATDLTVRSERALARALRLGQQFEAPLTVLHVVEEELPEPIARRRADEARALIQTWLGTLAANAGREAPDVEIAFGTDYAVIIRRAAELDAGLTVLGSHRESPWRDVFLGSTIERVLRQGDTPILTVKAASSADYRRVLVAVDFSVYARLALEFATKLVPGGEFTVLHAYDLPFAGFVPEAQTRHTALLRGEIGEQMDVLLRAMPPGPLQLRPEVRLGAPVPTVEAAVDEFRPDLLVVGTHGRTGVAHALLGSVAERLLRRPRCDVLAVRAW